MIYMYLRRLIKEICWIILKWYYEYFIYFYYFVGIFILKNVYVILSVGIMVIGMLRGDRGEFGLFILILCFFCFFFIKIFIILW